MRKYVVPIAALAGIALLSPRADAANLIIKSRVGCAGRPVSLPVAVSAPTSGTEMWGVDFALAWAGTSISPALDANSNSFTPTVAGTETPVVVTGAPTVGGGTNPQLYVGYVRGTSGMPLSTAGTAAPSAGIGLLRLQVAAGATAATTVQLSVPPTYNVKNDGTGNDVSRPGASGATSTATAGAAVNAETVTLYTGFLGGSAPAAGAPDLRVPLNMVAIDQAPTGGAAGGVGPGDLNADGQIGSSDLGNLAAATNSRTTVTAAWTDYKKIASDIGPLNGYTPTAIGGTAGQGYGDGQVGSADLGLMAAKTNGKASAANFPVCE